jgi:hypothetical protein
MAFIQSSITLTTAGWSRASHRSTDYLLTLQINNSQTIHSIGTHSIH